MRCSRITEVFRDGCGLKQKKSSRMASFERLLQRLHSSLALISAQSISFARLVRQGRLQSPYSASDDPVTVWIQPVSPRDVYSPQRATSLSSVPRLCIQYAPVCLMP